MYGKTVRVGSRVKHYSQRYTPYATATVRGFCDVGHRSPDWDGDTRLPFWIKVLVEHDDERNAAQYPNGWDWDRTQVASDRPSDAA